MDPSTAEDGAPAAKRPRIEAEALEWAESFGKKDSAAAGPAAGGGWALRNWTQEKEAERPPKPVSDEEDWSFFQQDDTTTASASPSTSGDSSSSAPPPSFKIPQGRAQSHGAKQRRVSFAEEVKVVTIPKAPAGSEETEEFDAEGNPLQEVSIDNLEGGDLAEGGGANSGDAPLQLSSSEAGAESLIGYLLAAIPAHQGKKKDAKYFGAVKTRVEGKSDEVQPRRPAPRKQLEDLDEDSFLEAFIDDSAEGTTTSIPVPQSIPIEEGIESKEKKAKKKPTFKF